MSVLFSDDFDSSTFSGGGWILPAGWTLNGSGDPTMAAQIGGCGYGNGISGTDWVSGKFFVTCNAAATQATHAFTSNPTTIAFRGVMAFLADSPSLEWETWLWCPTGPSPGFVFILGLRGNGQFTIRTNDVLSPTLSPSATGVFPVDGTPFALQWRMSLNSTTSVDVACDVNNATVWTHTYTATDNASGTNKWPDGACGTNWTAVTLTGLGKSSTLNQAVDTIEIDSSHASTTWSVCSDFEQLNSDTPLAVVAGLTLAAPGGHSFTITGTHFRGYDYPPGTDPTGFRPPFIKLKGPDGTEYFPNVGIDLPITYSTTSISSTLTDPITSGTWCAWVENLALCWETASSPEYVCFGGATLIVTKVTFPASATLFDLQAGPSLDPATFQLANGDAQTFSDIAIGTYHVTETPAPGYSTIIGTSNGSPHTAITVGADETVTVTVTNAASTNFPLRRERSFVLPPHDNLQTFLERLEFLIKSGTGNSDDPNPTFTIEISRDGGETFSAPVTLSIGAAGEFGKRQFTNRLGKYRIGTCRLTTSSPVFIGLLACYATDTPGTS